MNVLYEAPFIRIHAGDPDKLFATSPNMIDDLSQTLEVVLPKVVEG